MHMGVDDDELLVEGASARAPARTTEVNLVVELLLVLPRLPLTLAMVGVTRTHMMIESTNTTFITTLKSQQEIGEQRKQK
ncbi:hypothetical protein H5410_034355 [Solanum commersonii]|uniref:Uncharacterized protein n=1 Tax=Solanum commersonii TaxID=4109 RepID=A0A9J5YR61_SOLCO|nr:hypothetical protein H5410_034355 [Solanum commersonii]